MRIIAEIPHDDCKITIFSMNQKFIIKIEKGGYEQTYKVSELDVSTLEQIRELLTDDFIQCCLNRFEEMHKDFSNRLRSIA